MITPGRLWRGLVVLAVVAVALIGLRALAASTREAVVPAAGPAASATPSAEPAPSASLAATVAPAVTATPSRPAASPKPLPTPTATPREVAVKFVTAWMDTSGGRTPAERKKAWLARLRPLVTGDLYDGFASTDIERVPQGLVGRTRLVSQAGTSAVVIVSTSNGPLQVTLAQQPQGWVATSIDEAG